MSTELPGAMILVEGPKHSKMHYLAMSVNTVGEFIDHLFVFSRSPSLDTDSRSNVETRPPRSRK